MTKFILIILIFEFFSYGSPVTLTIPSQLTEGDTGVLTCDIGGALTIGTWKKGDNSAANIATCTTGGCTATAVNARYSYTQTATTMTLTINPLERTSDQGSWTCVQSTDFATKDIGTIYKTASSVMVTVSDRKLTCQTSCVYPAVTSDGKFTWSYNNNNQYTNIAGDAITGPTSSTDGCSNSEAKMDSILDIDKVKVDSDITVTFRCSFIQTGFTIPTESTFPESFTLSAGTTVSPSTTTTTPGTTATNTTSGPTKNTTSGPTNHTEGSTTNTISSTTASSNSLPVSVIIAISAGGGLVILVGITIAIVCYCKRKSNINETVDDKHRSGIDNHGIDLNEHSNRDHHL